MGTMFVAGRVIKQVFKDKRTLVLMFAAPLLIIFLLFAVFDIKAGKPNITAVNVPQSLTDALKKQANVDESTDKSASVKNLKARKTDAVVTVDGSKITVQVEGSQSDVTVMVKKAVAAAVAEYSKVSIKDTIQKSVEEQEKQTNEKMTAAVASIMQKARIKAPMPQMSSGGMSVTIPETTVDYTFMNGSDDMTTFESIAPILMGFFIFFFVFIIAGVAFLRERTSGTLDRVLATPIKRIQIVLGYFIGFGAYVVVQTVLIQLFMVYCLNTTLKGGFLPMLLINLLLASGSLALGTLLSAFARNEFQMFQFMPIVIVPQVLFCGLFSLRDVPQWVTVLSKIFPLTYGADAIKAIAIRGQSIGDIAPDLAVMAGYAAVFIVLNTLVLKKYRRI